MSKNIDLLAEALAILRELVNAGRRPERNRARREAEEFLGEILAGGPVAQKEIAREARERGISTATLRRAKTGLGVVSRRRGYGPGSAVQWQLSIDAQQGACARAFREAKPEQAEQDAAA